MAPSLTSPIDAYVRHARLVRVLDGDTLRLDIDCGFDVWRRVDVRLRDVNAPELPSASGIAARDFVEQRLLRAQQLTVRTLRTRSGSDVRSFVRYVADVWVDDALLADVLRAEGYAQ